MVVESSLVSLSVSVSSLLSSVLLLSLQLLSLELLELLLVELELSELLSSSSMLVFSNRWTALSDCSTVVSTLFPVPLPVVSDCSTMLSERWNSRSICCGSSYRVLSVSLPSPLSLSLSLEL